MPAKPPVVTETAIVPTPPADAAARGSDNEPDKPVSGEKQAAPAAQVQLTVTSLPPGAEVLSRQRWRSHRPDTVPPEFRAQRWRELELIVKLVGYRDRARRDVDVEGQ